tara:strand:- start:201 stop:392 length:192 start_codon:yes stop_codon:yes gene_type:complete
VVVSEVHLVIQAAVLLAKMVDLAVLVAEVKESKVLFPLVEQEIHLQLVQHKDMMVEMVLYPVV